MSIMTSSLFGGDNSSPSTSATSWNRINATSPSSWSTASENVRSTPVGGAFTLSQFYMQVDVAPGVGTSFAFTVMKNGVATALQVVISGTNTSGSDPTNSISVVAGDTLSIQCVPTGTPVTSTVQAWNFRVTTTDLTAPILSSYGAASTTVTNYGGLTAGHLAAWPTSDSDAQILVPTAGTLSNLYARLSSTPGSGRSYQFTLMHNGVATAMDITIGGTNSTGNDTVNSIAVAAGDSLSIRSIPAGTPTTQTSIAFGMTFTPTVPGETFFGYGSAQVPSASATNYEMVLGIGSNSWVASESGRTLVPGPYTKLTKLYVKLGTAPGGSGTRTITIRKASANTSLAAVLSNAATTSNVAANVNFTQGETITLQSSITGTPAALTGGVHTGVLMYEEPISTFVPVIMMY